MDITPRGSACSGRFELFFEVLVTKNALVNQQGPDNGFTNVKFLRGLIDLILRWSFHIDGVAEVRKGAEQALSKSALKLLTVCSGPADHPEPSERWAAHTWMILVFDIELPRMERCGTSRYGRH